MTATPGPHDASESPFIFAPDGSGTVKPWGPRFYEELGEDFGGFEGHLLIQTHSFSDPWLSWEVHPAGDEYVYLLAGETDFVLRSDGEDQVLRVSKPGSYVVVPRGVWHTARPLRPTTMLFVTPGAGTLNAETPHPATP